MGVKSLKVCGTHRESVMAALKLIIFLSVSLVVIKANKVKQNDPMDNTAIIMNMLNHHDMQIKGLETKVNSGLLAVGREVEKLKERMEKMNEQMKVMSEKMAECNCPNKGYKTFKKEAECFPQSTYARSPQIKAIKTVEDCANYARLQGARMFLTCQKGAYCYVYGKTSKDRCVTRYMHECDVNVVLDKKD